MGDSRGRALAGECATGKHMGDGSRQRLCSWHPCLVPAPLSGRCLSELGTLGSRDSQQRCVKQACPPVVPAPCLSQGLALLGKRLLYLSSGISLVLFSEHSKLAPSSWREVGVSRKNSIVLTWPQQSSHDSKQVQVKSEYLHWSKWVSYQCSSETSLCTLSCFWFVFFLSWASSQSCSEAWGGFGRLIYAECFIDGQSVVWSVDGKWCGPCEPSFLSGLEEDFSPILSGRHLWDSYQETNWSHLPLILSL